MASTSALALESITAILVEQGLTVTRIAMSTDPSSEDGEIRLTEEVHVQVGDSYLIANRWCEKEGTMYHGVTRDRSAEGVVALGDDIRTHLRDAKALCN